VKLILGVADIPYSRRPTSRPVAKPRKRNKPLKQRGSAGSAGSTTTTGDVAEILESKYGVMQAFADLYQPEIVSALESSVAGALESLQMGAPATINPYGSGLSTIEQDFRSMLDRRMLDGLIPGVPTKAAERGINHRLKRPYVKSNPARPSFLDTGTYSANFRAWIETS
jgi:hypothetical protein